ncbi:hypothetical protein ATSB10_13110 [Dyella thiooxydans]|uniref:Lipoprotein n=1 Tax=Dyella thiooxydans TaxID=445710 RepID=A0A161JX77_9GAMM|nr:hypothetical protein [Dyella thiooxydans]AND68765.1 hypothetical protein ATSB10_13110 [Dyella thiooxydans]
MRKMLLGIVLVGAASLLSGCYVAPDYSYVRGPDGGGAYYGRATRVYDDGYYAPYGYGYYDYPYGYYPGGVTVGIGTTWYGGSRHWRDDRDDRHWRGDDHRGHWDHDGDRHRDAPHPNGGHAYRPPQRSHDSGGQHERRRSPDERHR